jgi:hypothetical protein
MATTDVAVDWLAAFTAQLGGIHQIAAFISRCDAVEL